MMAEPGLDQLRLIDVGPVWRRALLVVPVALALLGAWFAVRWCVGNMIAEHAPDLEVATSAERLAPADPQSHFTLAVLSRNSFLPDALPVALRHYERAVGLSPGDYRLWIDLGRAREQAGDAAGGEKALRRAVELAPAYAYPRWLLGNLLLREGKQDEGFAELRRAGDADPSLRPQVFNLAWRAYGGDVPSVLSVIGDSGAARSQLAQFFIANKRLDEALELWLGLERTDQKQQEETGQALLAALFGQKRFHDVLAVHRTFGADLTTGTILNGGFEDDVGPYGAGIFGWQVVSDPRAQARIDAANFFRGKRSLRIIFNAATALDFQNVSQFVVVDSGARYSLEYFVRTEDLKSASTLIAQVVDAGDPKNVFATSDPAPNGTSGWQRVELEFAVPPKTEAITLRLVRSECITGSCPIFGKVWYDDFNLQRLGGGPAGDRGGRADGGRAQSPGDR